MKFSSLLWWILCRPMAAEECALKDDDAGLVQISAVTKLVTEGVTEPEELSSVDVEFSLVDADGVHLFDSHPSLLQKRGQSHLGDARSSSLRLTFEAHGHRVDLTFQKQRAPISRNATLTLGTASGMQQFHMRDRHVYVHPQAVLTSVASTVTGVLRNGEVFLDFELQKGHHLLTVRLAQKDLQAGIPQTIRKPLTLPERWTDCYEDDTETHALGMGIAVGSKLFSRFSDKDEAIDYVVQIVASSNLVYRPQLNFVLVVRKLHLQESHWQAPKWDQGPNCPMQMAEQLHAFDKWDPPGSDRLETEGQGLWTLLDDCYVSGTIGLAYVGTLCQMEKNYWGQRSNTGVVWHSFRTWITFAHEVGHNFGGEHSFELGKGRTGGIMDYGDGTLNGAFQFNSHFRKFQMCHTMNQALKRCRSAIWLHDGECGNGVLTDAEECECKNGSKSCAFCHDCTLEKGKSCTPHGYGVHPIGLGVGTADCCSSNGTFARSGAVCHVPGVGPGYCTAGLCIPSRCSDAEFTFVGDYCGLQPQNECKFMCFDRNGACSNMDGWLLNKQPANYVRNQVPCNWKKPGDGVCIDGSCIPAFAGCGNNFLEEDEECECKDGSVSCKFCSHCKLDKGRKCSPDSDDGMCCDAAGNFKSGLCQKGNFKGYCMQGLCHDTPCSGYKKSFDGWGEFCGVHNRNPCKFKCEVNGKCQNLRAWVIGGQPMNHFADGTHCQMAGREGTCQKGFCDTRAKKEVHPRGKSVEVVSFHPHGHALSNRRVPDPGAKKETSRGVCAPCLNGANCNLIRARSNFTRSCKGIELEYDCDCSGCSSCTKAIQPEEKYDGCPKTCGGWGWWKKSCDVYIWNSINKGKSKWTCDNLQNQHNCNCRGCLLCEHDFDDKEAIK